MARVTSARASSSLYSDGEGAHIEARVINEVGEILGQVAVLDAVTQTLTPSSECRSVSITARRITDVSDIGGPGFG